MTKSGGLKIRTVNGVKWILADYYAHHFSRYFDGKLYHWEGKPYSSKRRAAAVARRVRKTGKLARVVEKGWHCEPYYQIYVHRGVKYVHRQGVKIVRL